MQAQSLKNGKHTFWATRDILPEARDNFQAIIVKDLLYSMP